MGILRGEFAEQGPVNSSRVIPIEEELLVNLHKCTIKSLQLLDEELFTSMDSKSGNDATDEHSFIHSFIRSFIHLLLLHRPAKFYTQNVFCILMSDSAVVVAADLKDHICFSPSRHIFSLSVI